MSLLLDALKKAEQAKRKALQDQNAAATSVSAPVVESSLAMEPLPETPLPPVVSEAPANVSTSAPMALEMTQVSEPVVEFVEPRVEEPQPVSDLAMVIEPVVPQVVPETPAEEEAPAVEIPPLPVPEIKAEPKVEVKSEPEPKPEPKSEPKPAPVAAVPETVTLTFQAPPSPQNAQRILNASRPVDKRRRVLVAIVVGVILLLLAVGYVLAPLFIKPASVPMPVAEEASQPVASIAEASSSSATASTASAVPAAPKSSSTAVARPQGSSKKMAGPRSHKRLGQPSKLSSQTAAESLVTPTPSTPVKGPVLENTTPQPGIAPAVAKAYAAYQRGDLELAAKKYRQAVNEDDRNRDALLGLAATARRMGDLELARRAYKQLLYLNPQDVDAKAGLSATQGVSDPQSGVEALKPMGDQATNNTAVQSELGGMYVRQGRWSEAQAAYFNAFSANPGNPDLAFNLAICLDRLNQPKLALDYYRKARLLAKDHSYRFDLQQLDKRVTELEGSL